MRAGEYDLELRNIRSIGILYGRLKHEGLAVRSYTAHPASRGVRWEINRHPGTTVQVWEPEHSPLRLRKRLTMMLTSLFEGGQGWEGYPYNNERGK